MRTYEDTLPTSMTPDKRRYRQLEIWQIPHDNKTTWRVLHAAANAVAYAPGATGSFSESVFAD